MREECSVKDVTVKAEGTQIVLPVIDGKRMSYDEAIKWLDRKRTEDERAVNVYQEIPCSPLDGAVAFQRALSEKYGWTDLVPTPGFFGETPPTMVGVPVGAGEKLQVPWGMVQVPGIDGAFNTGMQFDPTPKFVIGGKVRRKHEGEVQEIVALTEKYLKEKSIYKGKAVKVSFEWERKEDDYNPLTHCPQFMDLNTSQEATLIFAESVQQAIHLGLFTPIEHSAACRKYQVPLKRGVLLYGPYGVGKTLTANVTAIKAIRNGWTFIYLDNVLDLKRGLEFAAQYAPAVLFAEDIDRVVTGERSVGMDEILNTLDGVDTKNGEVITVFTTNHVENINPAMLRMGRLDTLVEVLPPDAKAAERLVSQYGRGLLAEDVSLTRVGQRLAGRIPAFIREVTERAKIAAIARLDGGDISGQVTEADLLKSATAMEVHNSMLTPKVKGAESTPEVFVKVPANAKGAQHVLAPFYMNGAAAA